jgi:hypothetical protein
MDSHKTFRLISVFILIVTLAPAKIASGVNPSSALVELGSIAGLQNIVVTPEDMVATDDVDFGLLVKAYDEKLLQFLDRTSELEGNCFQACAKMVWQAGYTICYGEDCQHYYRRITEMLFQVRDTTQAQGLIQSFYKQFKMGFRPVFVDDTEYAAGYLKKLPENTWIAENGCTTYALAMSQGNIVMLFISKNTAPQDDASVEYNILATLAKLQITKLNSVAQ